MKETFSSKGIAFEMFFLTILFLFASTILTIIGENAFCQSLNPATCRHVWNGTEALFWNRQAGVKYSPDENRWCKHSANPNFKKASKIQMLLIDKESVIVGYVQDDSDFCFDAYSVKKDVWKRIGVVKQSQLETVKDLSKRARLFICGGIKLNSGALFFIGSYNSRFPATGILIDGKGNLRPIATKEAPGQSGWPVVYRDGDKAFLLGFWSF